MTSTLNEVLKLALKALEIYWGKAEHRRTREDERQAESAIASLRQAIAELESQEQNFCPRCGKRTNDIHTCTPPQRTEQEPVQVSPLEFVEMVMEKEHLIGKPIFWAEWPNKEKSDVAQETNS